MKKGGAYKIFGLILTLIGGAGLLFSTIIAIALVVADNEAERKNKAEWEEYIVAYTEDSIAEPPLLPDNEIFTEVEQEEEELIAAEDIPAKPDIRQGKMGLALGLFLVAVIAIIPLILLIIGILLLRKYKRKKRENGYCSG